MAKKHINCRVNDELILEFVESIQELKQEMEQVSVMPFPELNITNIVELALTYGIKQVKQEKETLLRYRKQDLHGLNVEGGKKCLN